AQSREVVHPVSSRQCRRRMLRVSSLPRYTPRGEGCIFPGAPRGCNGGRNHALGEGSGLRHQEGIAADRQALPRAIATAGGRADERPSACIGGLRMKAAEGRLGGNMTAIATTIEFLSAALSSMRLE